MPAGERLVATGALRLSVRDHPGGARPAVLALHGLASNARWWDLVATRLAPPRRMIAVDLRGHGRSDRPASGYGFDDVVGDLRGLLDAEGLDRVVVAGHSWGASVALMLAVAEPGRVAAVVCVEGGAGDLRSVFGDSWETAERAMTPPDLEGITEDALRSALDGWPLGRVAPVDEVWPLLAAAFEPAPGGGLRPRLRRDNHMEIARHLYEWDPLATAAAIRVPVRFLLAQDVPGRAMEAMTAAVDRMLTALGGRGRVTFAAGGHDLPVERPEEVAAVIDEAAAGV